MHWIAIYMYLPIYRLLFVGMKKGNDNDNSVRMLINVMLKINIAMINVVIMMKWFMVCEWLNHISHEVIRMENIPHL